MDNAFALTAWFFVLLEYESYANGEQLGIKMGFMDAPPFGETSRLFYFDSTGIVALFL